MAENQESSKQVVIVMRHGERLDHKERAKWNQIRGETPLYDPPLTDFGVTECREIASETLVDKGISLVISSPFYRCLQTAQEACHALQISSITIHNSVCETLTPELDFTGQPTVPRADLNRVTVALVQGENDHWPQYPESFESSHRRFESAIKELADQYYPRNILIVTHGTAVERAIVALGGKRRPLQLPFYCSQAVLNRASNKDHNWSLTSMYRVLVNEDDLKRANDF